MKITDDGRLRVVLIGLEHDHAWWILQDILMQENMLLAGVADPHEHLHCKLRKVLKQDVEIFRNYREMLDIIKPAAAIVTSKNSEHREILENCALRGIHFFTQKPAATCSKDAEAMDKLSREAGILSMINCYPLWNPIYQKLFSEFQRGITGTAFKYLSFHGHQGPKGLGCLTEDYVGWLYDPEKSGGGALMDQGTYGLNYALYFMGKPQAVYACIHIVKPDENSSVEDDSLIVLRYPVGTAVIHGSYGWPSSRNIVELYGPRGGLKLNSDGLVFEKTCYPARPAESINESITICETEPERRNGIAYFADCILNRKDVLKPFTTEFNVLVAQITEAAYASARTGSIVSL